MAECRTIADEEVSRQHFFYYSYPYPYLGNFNNRKDRFFYRSQDYHYKTHREQLERHRYFRICMKAKGWTLVKIDLEQAQQSPR